MFENNEIETNESIGFFETIPYQCLKIMKLKLMRSSERNRSIWNFHCRRSTYVNSFHVTGNFLYSLETSENGFLMFSGVIERDHVMKWVVT